MSKLTAYQQRLLERIGSGAYVHGSAEVQAARRLEALGLVTVRDDGYMPGESRAQEPERWWVRPTTHER